MLASCRVPRILDLFPTRPVLMQVDDFVLLTQQSFSTNFPVTLLFLPLFLLFHGNFFLFLFVFYSRCFLGLVAPMIFLVRPCSLDVDHGLHCYQADILDLVGKRWHLVTDCISCDLRRRASNDVRACEPHKLPVRCCIFFFTLLPVTLTRHISEVLATTVIAHGGAFYMKFEYSSPFFFYFSSS